MKLLAIPYRFLYPSALFFVCIGVYAANNGYLRRRRSAGASASFGYVLLRLGFHPAPILLGFVLGPRFEENFRRAMLISRGDLRIFVERPLTLVFLLMSAALLLVQMYARWRARHAKSLNLSQGET